MNIGKSLVPTIIIATAAPSMGVNLAINGSFESIGIPGFSGQLGDLPQARQPGTEQSVDNWTTTGFNFVFLPGEGTTVGAYNSYDNYVTFYGTPAQNGGVSATEFPATSPDGGNFVALDGAFGDGTQPFLQTINGLTTGALYEVSFFWAAAQQVGFDGDTTSALSVSFGSSTQSTPVFSLPNHDFSGWMTESFTFTADAASQTLSFLAVGTPDGLPPFALLDGVSVTQVPEASTSAAALLGIATFGITRRRRAKA